MREQTGYVFRRYDSWFVRYYDDVKQPDGSYKRKLVCKKLDKLGEGATKRAAREEAKAFLAPINSGTLNPASTQTVIEFVDKIYLPEYVEKQLRAATLKQYRDVWNNHLKPRMGNLTLRSFRAVDGEFAHAGFRCQRYRSGPASRQCRRQVRIRYGLRLRCTGPGAVTGPQLPR